LAKSFKWTSTHSRTSVIVKIALSGSTLLKMASRGKMGTYGKKKKRSFLGLSSLFRDTKSEARDNSKKEGQYIYIIALEILEVVRCI
jgi:hypothetical protein